MKTLADNTEVLADCYYWLLDWRDKNMEEFAEVTGKMSVHQLNKEEFWAVYKTAGGPTVQS